MAAKIKKTYYSYGKIAIIETPYLNNKLHGVEIAYFKSGKVYRKTPFVEGKRHGIGRHYYANGILFYRTGYLNGKIHGQHRRYNRNRSIRYTEYFLYDDGIAEEDWKRHELIERLAGLK